LPRVLRRITTSEEPEIATFELPISYDVLTNRLGLDERRFDLRLLVDPDPDGYSGIRGELQDCERATNGDCLLAWNTSFDPPGTHPIQARLLFYGKRSSDNIKIRGPALSFVSSNICEFEYFFSEFDALDAILYAKLPESNATFTIELKTPDGAHIKALKGSTSNGVIRVKWDLMDDKRRLFTNESFDALFNVTLSDSKRSQTMREECHFSGRR
jgi:hypothetical protein